MTLATMRTADRTKEEEQQKTTNRLRTYYFINWSLFNLSEFSREKINKFKCRLMSLQQSTINEKYERNKYKIKWVKTTWPEKKSKC